MPPPSVPLPPPSTPHCPRLRPQRRRQCPRRTIPIPVVPTPLPTPPSASMPSAVLLSSSLTPIAIPDPASLDAVPSTPPPSVPLSPPSTPCHHANPVADPARTRIHLFNLLLLVSGASLLGTVSFSSSSNLSCSWGHWFCRDWSVRNHLLIMLIWSVWICLLRSAVLVESEGAYGLA
jgi:hypothetical protein